MKRTIKYITALLLIVCLVSILIPTVIFADNVNIENAVRGVTDSAASANSANDANMAQLGAMVLHYIQWAGTVLAVLLLIWFGIKWMISGAQQRAQLKDQAWNYVFGAILLFGAGSIAQWVYSIVTTNVK